jgi:putative DNA-invertase from lambdoid prophage Rac
MKTLSEQPNQLRRAAIYARVSTRDQELENQLRQLRDYAASQGWKIVAENVDVASGGKGQAERQGLDETFRLAHQRKFDVLLFWSLDRLSREGSRKTIEYLTRLEAAGAGWHSYTEPYLSSLGIFGDAIIALLSALARQEKVRIGERTKAGMARAKAEGKRIGRPAVDVELARTAAHLRGEGLSFAEIGQRLGLSRSKAYHLATAATAAQHSVEADSGVDR